MLQNNFLKYVVFHYFNINDLGAIQFILFWPAPTLSINQGIRALAKLQTFKLFAFLLCMAAFQQRVYQLHFFNIEGFYKYSLTLQGVVMCSKRMKSHRWGTYRTI